MNIQYTYLIGWIKLNKWYYGVRYAKECHPDDLWNPYKTSSPIVANFIKENGDPDIIQIRKIFKTVKNACDWETKVLKRMNILKHDKWLNGNIAGAIDPVIISKSNKTRVENKTHPFLFIDRAINYQSSKLKYGGNHPAIGNSDYAKKLNQERVENKTHNFLKENGGSENAKKTQLNKVKNKTHPWLKENGWSEKKKNSKWIYHPITLESKSIDKKSLNYWLERGWILGRKLKPYKPRVKPAHI